MTKQPVQPFEALLAFDANLPVLDKCKSKCESTKSVRCIHRFDHMVQVINYDPQRFPKWSDLGVVTHFFGHILKCVAKGVVVPNSCVFIILTKDRNFIEDVKKEWEEKKAGTYLPFVFSGNFISCGGLVVFIQQIYCVNHGSKRKGNLDSAFSGVNDFFTQRA